MFNYTQTYPTTISVGVAASERIMVVPPPPTAMPESVAPRFTTRPGIKMSLFQQKHRLYKPTLALHTFHSDQYLPLM